MKYDIYRIVQRHIDKSCKSCIATSFDSVCDRDNMQYRNLKNTMSLDVLGLNGKEIPRKHNKNIIIGSINSRHTCLALYNEIE
jgi:hypothetical protein